MTLLSVVDYVLVSPMLFHFVKYFAVGAFCLSFIPSSSSHLSS